MKRRSFITNTAGALASLYFLNLSCKQEASDTTSTTSDIMEPWFKLSLAQWSLNEGIKNGSMDPFDFAKVAKELGFTGLEYVNQLYHPWLDENFPDDRMAGVPELANRLKAASDATGMDNLILMIDAGKELAMNSAAERQESIAIHHAWIDAAATLGCHSVRINLFGDGSDEEVAQHATNSWQQLCDYAQPKNVHVLVENHGWQSSNPEWLIGVLKAVDRDNAGLLPDFGNFCVKRKDGEKWGECVEEYPDIYEGVKLMMPYAKGVSAKSYGFDADGNESKLDYEKLLNIVKDSGYIGYIGVEFEGGADEKAGITATKDLLLKLA
ncbi:MAG: sugar phosphate isomerase/epimerase [Saprospiraceae bacterium]|nr:sugar phosphate isomerase/epimerase [Saprospiraceae bacterium]